MGRAWIIHDITEPLNQPCNLLAPDSLLNEMMIIFIVQATDSWVACDVQLKVSWEITEESIH